MMGPTTNPFKPGCSGRYHTRLAESDAEELVVVNKKKRPVRRRTGLHVSWNASVSAQSHAVTDGGAEGDQAGSRGERHDRRHLNRLLPPRQRDLRNIRRKRGHDLRRHVRRRHHVTATLGFLFDTVPQIDLPGRFRTECDRLRCFAVEPAVDHLGRRRPAKRNFPIAERLRVLRGSARALAPSVAAAVACVQVVLHYAYFSSRRAWSASRARCTRIFRAPTVVPNKSAISSYDRPSTCFITNASRNDGARVISALSRSERSSVRSNSSSGV